MDLYEGNAEWYAALVAPGREATDLAVRRLLGDLRGGDVVELGAGVGTCLPTLRSLGADRIYAVEPSPWMRVGLMTTIGADPDLLARTTVLPGDLATHLDRLPVSWAGIVMLNAIGHLDDDARTHLWCTVADRLAPSGRFVLTLQPPARPTAIPWTDFGVVAVGEHELRTRGRADLAGDHHVDWTMEWSLHDADGDLLDRRSAISHWRTLSAAEAEEEAAAVGLRLVDEISEMSALAFGRR